MATHTCRDCGKVFTVPDWLSNDIFCPSCRKPVLKQPATGDPRSGIAKPTPAPPRPAPAPDRLNAAGDAAVPLEMATARPGTKATSSAPGGVAAVLAAIPRPQWSMRRYFTGRNKFLLFGLIGAIGCSLGALLGELVLLMTRIPPPESPMQSGPTQALCILLDCSGSMGSWETLMSFSSKLSEAKSAAKGFADRQVGTENQIAVVGFGSQVHPATGLTTECTTISRAIDGLQDGGSTEMASALDAAAAQLDGTSLPRNILLFTDGMPEIAGLNHQQAQDRTLQAAEACRRRDIKIVAIATGDADVGFLARVTGDRTLVIPATAGNFGQGFDQAAKVIYGRSLVESSATDASFKQSLLRVGGWTAMLALGLSLALIAGQNLYLGRRFLSVVQGSVGTFGGLAAGLAAGATGQFLFSPFSRVGFLQSTATVVGWGVLGALVGRGIAYFVPNLAARRAWIGGGIGGGIAAVAFLWTSTYVSDVLGRLLGAAILGLVIGLLIAWIEAAFREAWLEIGFGPNEVVKVSLGPETVSIGSDAKACTVFVYGAAPIAFRYWLRNGVIECQDGSTSQTTQVRPGDRRTIGNASVTVCGAG